MKIEYWTMWGAMWGGHAGLCSVHKTLRAAKKAAETCEKDGGAKHVIVKVQRMKR